MPLGNELMDDLAMHIGQSKIPPAISMGKTLMIEPHQMQDGGMKVVQVHLVFDRIPTKFIGCTMDMPSSNPTTRETQGIAVGVMLSSISPLTRRRSPEFAPPDDQRFIKQTTPFEILNERGHRTIGRRRVLSVPLLQLPMLIPIQSVSLTALYLNEPDSSLNHSSRQQTPGSKASRRRIVESVAAPGHIRFPMDLKCLGGSDLHSKSELKALEPSLQNIILPALLLVPSIQLPQQIELSTLFPRGQPSKVPQIGKGSGRFP